MPGVCPGEQEESMKNVVIAGAGASGMMAAVTAAAEGARVILLEHKDRIGKKILSTGNGRCNFTNICQEPVCYHSDQPEFPWKIVEKFGAQDIISFFLQLGIYSKTATGICTLIRIRLLQYWMHSAWNWNGCR